jgi:hypothetical protein
MSTSWKVLSAIAQAGSPSFLGQPPRMVECCPPVAVPINPSASFKLWPSDMLPRVVAGVGGVGNAHS